MLVSISQALSRIGFPLSLPYITAGAVALATTYYILIDIYEINKPRAYRNIPKINSLKLVYETLLGGGSFQERYEKYIRENEVKYGIVRSNQLGRHIVYVGSSDYARQILVNHETFGKLIATEQFPHSFQSRFLGNNIAFSNGDMWRRYRRVCNPAFHHVWPTESVGVLTQKMLKRIRAETKDGAEPVEIVNLMKRITLDTMGQLGFGFDFNSIDNPQGEYPELYKQTMGKLGSYPLYTLLPWLDSIPFLHRTKLFNSADKFDNIIFRLIDTKRKEIHEGIQQTDDFLSLLIKSNESEEGGLSDEELRSNVVVLFIAGHDTTALALSFALYYLARHPKLQERLHDEIIEFLGPADSSDPTPVPTVDDSKNMPLLNAVIKEAMRLNPSVPLLPPRAVAADTPVGPYVIPPGVEVRVNIYGIQHNSEYWKDPDQFSPERFLDESKANDKKGSCQWLPFSYGSRSCAGMNLSLVEQRVVLSMLIHKYKIALPANSPHADNIKVRFDNFADAPLDLKLNFVPRY